ncbi:MAG: arginase family protein [Candidatus Pacearchaeota archaeon]|jgi:agmatinase
MEIIRLCVSEEKILKVFDKMSMDILGYLNSMESNEKGILLKKENFFVRDIFFDKESDEEKDYLISRESKEIFEKNDKSLFIGDNHKITYSIAKAFLKNEKNPLLIIFDAHLDSLSIDKGFISERNWLKKLVESGFPSDKILFISARNLYEEELNFLKKNKLAVIKMDVLDEDKEGVCDLVMERARNASGFYISIDMDSIDPAFAPGVYTPEPGGLSSRDIIYFIKRLILLKNFKAADIVNIDINKDINDNTLKLAAKIFSEMI